MKYLIAGIAAIALSLSAYAGAQCCPTDKAGSKVSEVTTSSLKKMIDEKSVVILDARMGKWDDGKRIPGATGIGPKPTAEQLASIAPDKNATIVTYCGGVKCPLSNKLASALRAQGYTKVLEYKEGIAGWVEAGNTLTN